LESVPGVLVEHAADPTPFEFVSVAHVDPVSDERVGILCGHATNVCQTGKDAARRGDRVPNLRVADVLPPRKKREVLVPQVSSLHCKVQCDGLAYSDEVRN